MRWARNRNWSFVLNRPLRLGKIMMAFARREKTTEASFVYDIEPPEYGSSFVHIQKRRKKLMPRREYLLASANK